MALDDDEVNSVIQSPLELVVDIESLTPIRSHLTEISKFFHELLSNFFNDADTNFIIFSRTIDFSSSVSSRSTSESTTTRALCTISSNSSC